MEAQTCNEEQDVPRLRIRARALVARRGQRFTASTDAHGLDALVDILTNSIKPEKTETTGETQIFLQEAQTRIRDARERVQRSLRDVREACGTRKKDEVVQSIQNRDSARRELRDLCDSQLKQIGDMMCLLQPIPQRSPR
jgi:hypothetical protein